MNLCIKVLEYIDLLKYKGHLVIKLFQGADYDSFYKRMKKHFFNIRSLKPESSYKKSNEIYLIGLNHK